MPNIEEVLRKAMEEGKFDNLPGKGKPLNLEQDNPHANPEWELAYHIIKEAGYSLPWIETIREIEGDIETARQELRRAWEWRQAAGAVTQTDSRVSEEWERALKLFKQRVDSLNRRIRDYNLEVPNARFQRPVLSLEREVERITER